MTRLKAWLNSRRSGRSTLEFLLASLVLGILVGLGAALLVLLIGWVLEGVVRIDNVLGWGRWIFVVSVPIGLLAAWILDRRLGPGVSSGGVSEVMVGLAVHGGYLSTRLIPAKILATAATLGTGGSGGREGPIALIGGAIGSSLARYTRFGHDQIRSMVAAGAGAGVGASFNAPIAGMLFAMEVILRSFAVRHLNAVVIASVAAAVTTQTLIGEERILTSPPHELDDPKQLLLYAVLALLAVLFGFLFLKILDFTASLSIPKPAPRWTRPLMAGFMVGMIGVVAPRTLGTGQEFLSELLALEDAGDFVWYALFALAALKAVTSAVTRAGGGSAGTFMPALFIGGAVGAGFAILVDPLWTLSDIDPGSFAVVGMAATFAAVARAPLTSVIIVFEVTGDYGLVLPLMLGAALATFLGDRLHEDSAYTLPLTKQGIRIQTTEDIDLLDTVTVGDVMAEVDEVADPAMSVNELDALLNRGRHHGAAVVAEGQLVGMATLTDVAKRTDPQQELTVRDVMTPKPITVTPSMQVSAALARMASLGIGRLPVVSDADPETLVGMFRRESVVRAYHHALGMSTGRHLYRERVRLRSQQDTTFFEVPVRHASPVAGRPVRDITWPDGATLVSVRRGSAVLIPHGSTVLENGDTLTLFGTGESREELSHLLEPRGEPTQEWRPPAED